MEEHHKYCQECLLGSLYIYTLLTEYDEICLPVVFEMYIEPSLWCLCRVSTVTSQIWHHLQLLYHVCADKHNFVWRIDYNNLPRFCTGTGKSTRVKDLQSTTRLAESWTLQIFDRRVDFPIPVQSRWLFFPTALNPHDKPPLLILKSTSKHFLDRNGANLG